MVQWWERSPSTNVSRVQFTDPASYVGWVCCWFSSLLWEVFLWVLRFPLSSKTNNSQIPIRSLNARTFLNEFCELLGAPWVNKLHLYLFTFYIFYKLYKYLYGVSSRRSIAEVFDISILWTLPKKSVTRTLAGSLLNKSDLIPGVDITKAGLVYLN